MLFCPKCGTQMSDNAQYCMKCGANLRDYYSDAIKKEWPEGPPEKSVKCSICGKEVPGNEILRCSVCGKKMCKNCADTVKKAITMNRMDRYYSRDLYTVNRRISYELPICLDCALDIYHSAQKMFSTCPVCGQTLTPIRNPKTTGDYAEYFFTKTYELKGEKIKLKGYLEEEEVVLRTQLRIDFNLHKCGKGHKFISEILTVWVKYVCPRCGRTMKPLPYPPANGNVMLHCTSYNNQCNTTIEMNKYRQITRENLHLVIDILKKDNLYIYPPLTEKDMKKIPIYIM